MDKYGVDTQSEAAKTAATKDDPRCPRCDSPLIKSANVPKCPKCGTEPFESKA
jgi:ribosomal protein L37AE/L43A